MKILTQLSGGLDSVAVLNELVKSGIYDTIYPVFFNYGQPYQKQELKAALYATRFYQDRTPLVVRSLLEVDLPLQVASTTEVKEYVPMRNLALTAVSANIAASLGCSRIAVGSKSTKWRPEDPYSFKDSTFDFYAALEYAISVATEPGETPIRVLMPCLGWSKTQVVLSLMKAGIHLNKLWSCYRDQDHPCGECYHCKEIEKAMKDPLIQEWMHREVAS
ncbi:MAG: 7-cyano-7-deazaguanine synthase [candidate division WOR-3 bacterium]